MCDDRERLIGYVYDDCDAHERREIEAHLETCHTCRREIMGLRDVRQDLLAWDVPETPSVWRPFAPQRAKITWRDVPTWMLAAAASLVFVAGAVGGVATQLMLPRTPQIVTTAPPPPLVAATAASGGEGLANVSLRTSAPGVSAQDLSALEQRLLAQWRAELNQRLRTVTSPDEVRAIRAELSSFQIQQDGINVKMSNLYSGLADDVRRKPVSVGLPGAGLESNK